MSGFVEGLITGVIGGVVGSVVGGYMLSGIIRESRRLSYLRMLRTELKNFQGNMVLPPLVPRTPQLISTVNATLLENALVSDVWDLHFDIEAVAKLADLMEQIKRYNDKVRTVNSFFYGPAFGQKDSTDEYTACKVLHKQLTTELAEIAALLDGFIAFLDQVLCRPIYNVGTARRFFT